METYVASAQRPLEKCLADVRACDVYVGIFAWRFGYQPPGREESITELEFREASAAGKRCLMFLLAEDAPWPATLIDGNRERIQRLRDELQRDYTVTFFSSADELSSVVGVAVSNTLRETVVDPDPVEDPNRQRFYRDCLQKLTRELGMQIRYFSILSGTLLLAGAMIAGLGMAMGSEAIRLPVGFGGGLVGTTTVFPLNMMFSTRKKKALLDGYEAELGQESPAREAVAAIQTFLRQQLQ